MKVKTRQEIYNESANKLRRYEKGEYYLSSVLNIEANEKFVKVDDLLDEINYARDNGNIEGEKGFSAALLLSKIIKKLEEERAKDKSKTFTVYLNAEEVMLLEKCKAILEQEKDSTALKQLAWIGANMLHDEKIEQLLAVVFKNKRNNSRLGIHSFE